MPPSRRAYSQAGSWLRELGAGGRELLALICDSVTVLCTKCLCLVLLILYRLGWVALLSEGVSSSSGR